jgi:hypothetical protein
VKKSFTPKTADPASITDREGQKFQFGEIGKNLKTEKSSKELLRSLKDLDKELDQFIKTSSPQ